MKAYYLHTRAVVSRLDYMKRIGLVGTLILALGFTGCNQPTDDLPVPGKFTADQVLQLLGMHAWKLQLVVPPQKDSLHIGMFTQEGIVDYVRLSLDSNAYAVKFALSFRINMQGETAEAGIILDSGGSMRASMALPPWFTGMPRTHDPMLVGNRYAVLSMEKDGKETVHYGFWVE